ncbi:MAG TPA: hypothetical protein VHV47_14040 [Opitutaceae bacterium]|jgi:hypothetical protein|nr:hypothetical protein [Opitutaceae bacterium]
MKLASVLAFFALLSAAQAAPAILSRDAQGVTVNADLIRRYAQLCARYPAFGDKAGDGVFIVDVDQFHLDNKHYLDYLSMIEMDKNAGLTRN